MEQNYLWNALAAAFSRTDWVPNMNQTGNKSGDAVNDFQKLLEQKSQTGKPESTSKETGATQKETTEPGQKTQEEAPVKGEDALERIKKLAEMGYAVVQPSLGVVNLDGESYEPGEYVMALNGSSVEIIPTVGLDEAQMGQLQQMLANTGSEQVLDYVDPAAGQMLKETAPEEVVETQFVQDVAETKVEEPDVKVETRTEAPVQVERQEQETDGEVELTDVETAPAPVFRNVESAPIKVGEAPAAEENQLAADVSGQIDTALTNAAANGQNRVELQLTPENLGKVTIEITYNRHGVVESVLLSAERSETQNLLSRHTAGLQNLLSRSGEPVQVEVQRNEESQQQHNDQYDGHNGHNGQNSQEREHRQHRQEHETRDFLQQLRLGLIPMDSE